MINLIIADIKGDKIIEKHFTNNMFKTRRSQRSSGGRFGWRLRIEIKLGLTEKATQDRRVLWLRLIFVLVYSRLEQNEQLLFHVEINH